MVGWQWFGIGDVEGCPQPARAEFGEERSSVDDWAAPDVYEEGAIPHAREEDRVYEPFRGSVLREGNDDHVSLG
jgi:hypothetical protein